MSSLLKRIEKSLPQTGDSFDYFHEPYGYAIPTKVVAIHNGSIVCKPDLPIGYKVAGKENIYQVEDPSNTDLFELTVDIHDTQCFVNKESQQGFEQSQKLACALFNLGYRKNSDLELAKTQFFYKKEYNDLPEIDMICNIHHVGLGQYLKAQVVQKFEDKNIVLVYVFSLDEYLTYGSDYIDSKTTKEDMLSIDYDTYQQYIEQTDLAYSFNVMNVIQELQKLGYKKFKV